MKKLDRLVLLQFLRSFLLTFLISVFVFLMIFIFVYIDEFVGKSIGIGVLLKLFGMFAINTITRALPLAILLSSVMTVGHFTEHFELSAMKSGGVGFMRVCRPLLLCCVTFGVLLFLCSNYVLPRINLNIAETMNEIRFSRPAVLFREGSFSSEVPGYSFKIGKIGSDGRSFDDILIYDHSEGEGNSSVLSARSGTIVQNNDSQVMIFLLNDGYAYKELTDSSSLNTMMREHFKEKMVRVDLSGGRRIINGARETNYTMMNMSQITRYCDSLTIYNKALQGSAVVKNESVLRNISLNADAVLVSTLEWHRRIAVAFSCLLMFLIGAPLGVIVRKGGMGMPMVVSTVVYITFHTITIIGEKLAEDESVSPVTGIWLAIFCLLPPFILLMWLAARDKLYLQDGWLKNLLRRS